MNKICTICKVEKKIEEFSHKEDGYNSRCRACCNEIEKQRRLNHMDKFKNRDSQYYKNNTDKVKDRSRKYRKDNPETRKQWEKTHREQYLLYAYRSCDKKRGLICNLTIEWMKENITSKPCAYCQSVEDVGCDRVNNNLGHSIDNVIPACWECNRLRGKEYSLAEMMIIGPIAKQVRLNRKTLINKG